ncbi:MAG TPA: 3-oxoacyl-ACP synthase [Gaiellaceae bacterium]|nr:3-oxoacyl-ACP synthase [Gaiellaceae bacterium]
MTRVGIPAVASYLPERWMPASEVASASGIPEQVVVERFGLRGKHIAAVDEHVTDLSVAAGERVLEAAGLEPADVDVVAYFGSSWKEWPVWQAAPWIAHRLGCANAWALELDYVSCGAPVALRVCRDLLVAEPEVRSVLIVGACRESYLLDYANERSRFMFNFGDGAVAAIVARDAPANELLGSAAITDGSLSLHVKVPEGGSVHPETDGGRFLDVDDLEEMKERLDEVSLANFVRVSEEALRRSGAALGDIGYLCGIHMKRSMHDDLIEALGLPPDRAAYLDDTGHVSGADPLLALDRAARAEAIEDGELVLLLAAGTGYTWAASVVRWGPM